MSCPLIFYTMLLLVMAACSIANIVKSSLGPVGLDKMLVDDIGVSNITFLVHSIKIKLLT